MLVRILHNQHIQYIFRKIYSVNGKAGDHMSISSISSSSASLYTYQWNNQQLQGATSSSNAASSSAYSTDTMSTISSMVELAKYAMDAMGVSSNERVTFSQIEVYKQELEEKFSESLNAAIESTNISDNASFTLSLDAEGKVSVNTTHEDKAKIQAYFDLYPEMTNNLRKELDAAGFEGAVQFSISSTGIVSAASSVPTTHNTELKESTFGTDLLEGVNTEEEKIAEPFSLSLEEGMLSLTNDEHEHSEGIKKYIEENPDLAEQIQNEITAAGITADEENIRINIDIEGKVSIEHTEENPENIDTEALQDFLTEKNVGKDMKTGLKNIGIDPSVDFRLTVENGKVVVNSSHPDAVKVQILLDKSEELTKDYLQVDALAGLDGARKAMQIDPSAMRKRIEMESMSAWWSTTGTSSVGSFTDGSLSSYAGVNSIV